MAEPKPPTGELGAPHSSWWTPGITPGWSSFQEPNDYVAEWVWPRSTETVERMITDGQVEALGSGTMLPVRQRVWTIDPNGADDGMVEALAEDVGLPIRGEEDENVPRRPAGSFDFDTHLEEALLAIFYGHYYFEQVGEVIGDMWRLRKLGPRAPSTIDEIRVARDGGLVAIRQGMVGGTAISQSAPTIPVERLVAYVWRGEARTRWIGRASLRALYRHWLVKDRLIRVDAINLERPSGAPIFEAPEGASKKQIEELDLMARESKFGEHAGGAVPYGTRPHFPDGKAPDTIASIKYHDEAMARAWLLMLIQLGTTETGSRALGGTFADFFALALNAIAGWFVRTFNQHVIDDWVEWNYGPSAKFAPRLHQRERDPEEGAPPSTEELGVMVDKGLLTVDGEVETWLRQRRGLPALAEDAPPRVPEVAAGGRARPTRAASGPQPPNGRQGAVRASGRLPERELRRQPYEHEIRAAVDFAALETIYLSALDRAIELYDARVIPAQIAEARDAITTTKQGNVRTRVTQADMARVRVSGMGFDELNEILLSAAKSGAAEAVAELVEQAVIVPAPTEEALAAKVADQARAVTDLAAEGMSLAVQRRAVQLAGGGATPEDIADGVVEHLTGLKHQFTLDQLRGAVTMAQNVGRTETFAKVPAKAVAYYAASEILDASACDSCVAVDGTEYESLDEAMADYPSGGFSECAGGPRCRGTLVAVAASEQAEAA